jgi:hypothetical protein
MKRNLFITILIGLAAIFLVGLSLQGIKGNPNYFQNHLDIRGGGPYESSGSTSRFALTKSIVDNHSLSLSKELAIFASPDITLYNGKFFTIFAPGISFLAVPLYMLGQYFHEGQMFTYFLNVLFGLLNIFLIYKVSKKLKIPDYLGWLSGFVFLFATNALAYVGTLTQHQVSTSLVLLATLNSFEERNLKQNIIFGLLFAGGILVDIPNAFMMMPALVLILVKHFDWQETKQKIKINFKLSVFGLVLGLIPLLICYGIYNHQLTGSYIKIGQFIGRTAINSDATEKVLTNNTGISSINKDLTLVSTPYNPRLELNGFYILLFSDERGIFYYSPILLIGFLGLVFLYRHKEKRVLVSVLAGVALICVLTYSMFGDPWGGWGFGARYMIPAEAILSIGIGEAIDRFRRKLYLLFIAGALLIYSVAIAVVGAITTTSIPPRVEAIHLSTFIPYTYQRGIDLIHQNISNSLIFNSLLINKINVSSYYLLWVVGVLLLISSIYGLYIFDKGGEK